jgi:hypothetical protein
VVSDRGLCPNRLRAKAAAVAEWGLWDVVRAAAVARDIPLATDSAQYREGKVKSTPEGGCQDLKPRAPEQSEPEQVG